MDVVFVPELFLEVAELNRFKQSLGEEGFISALKQHSASFGLVKNQKELIFDNARVERGIDTSLGQRTLKVKPINGFDRDGLHLTSKEKLNIVVPADDNWYWLRIKHKYSTIEKGTVSVSITGDLTGVGTEFTKILRGMPNFPSRIKFTNSIHNTLEYDILEVIDDEHATIMHPAIGSTGIATFDIEENLEYSVVGTYTPGVPIPNKNKFPFRYDDVEFELVKETSDNTPPLRIVDKEFYIARVRVEKDDIVIQDKRTELWSDNGFYEFLRKVDKISNPLIGVESIRWKNILAPSNNNIVEIGWGMRSQNWAVDASKNIITLFGSAKGGRFKNVDDFTNGNFDGWRLYAPNGSYHKVISSIKQGQAINLTLDTLDIDNFSFDGGKTFTNEEFEEGWVFVCPDVEEVELLFTPDPEEEVENCTKSYTFPINTILARCDVEVYKSQNCLYNVKYRYKNQNVYSAWKALPSDSRGYYTESSFNQKGVLRGEGDRTVKPYLSNFSQGYIELVMSANSYNNVVETIFKGDKIGVNTITSFDGVQTQELKIGKSKRYQYVTGAISLSEDVFFSLSDTNAVEGNEFRIHFDAVIIPNGYKIKIITGVDSGNLVVLKELDAGDFFEMRNRDGGLIFTCVFSDQKKWEVCSQNYDLGQPFEIKMFRGDVEEYFDSSLRGKKKGYFGWVIDTVMQGKVPIGYGKGRDINNEENTFDLNSSGGEYKHKLTKQELPTHNHEVKDPGHSHNYGKSTGWSNSGSVGVKGNGVGDYWTGRMSTGISLGDTGGDEAHNNLQPYYVVAFIRKTY